MGAKVGKWMGRSAVGVTAAILLAGPGCGVRVGNGLNNGLREISGPGFSISVDERLSVTTDSVAKKVTVDNRKILAASEAQQVSTLTLTADESTSLRDVKDLYAIARQEHSYAEFKPVTKPGVTGIMREAGEGSLMQRYYYWVSGAGKLIRGNLTAYPAGQGKELIPAAADSFSPK